VPQTFGRLDLTGYILRNLLPQAAGLHRILQKSLAFAKAAVHSSVLGNPSTTMEQRP
jgi:hypothetical protein